MRKNTVINDYGVEIDFVVAFDLMDEEIREDIHLESNYTQQEFFDRYAEEHEKKYGEVWELAKANPCY